MAKKYTRAEWSQRMAKLPEEDRTPYEDSPDAPTPAAPKGDRATVETAPIVSGEESGLIGAIKLAIQNLSSNAEDEDAYYQVNPLTGTSPAQDDAQALVDAAEEGQYGMDLNAEDGADAGLSMLGIINNFIVGRGGDPIDITGNIKTNGTTTTTLTTTVVTTTPTTSITTTTPTTTVTTTTPTTSVTTVNPEIDYLRKLLEQLQKQYADLIANNEKADAAAAAAAADAKAAAEALAKEKRQSAIDVLTARFKEYGLETLVPDIIRLATEGASQDTISLELQKTDAYKRRFRANEERLKKGLAVLTPGEYIGMEDNYRQMLRAYGLNQFNTDDYVSQFIANDVSQAELSSRITTAVQRVQNADPAVAKTLRDFYGIGQNDLVAYILDPNQQLPKIERQVAAAEIGTAARLQGLEAGVGVAEQLAAQGISKAEAQKGYATIADILPEATKLSQIYGTTMEGYGLQEAEQEVFNQLASAQRKRRNLTQREIAQFSGASGVGKASLAQQVKGQF